MITTAWSFIIGLVFSTVTSTHAAAITPTVDIPSVVDTNIVATSTHDSVELAKCLSKKGAQMYGAYWCPHCADQKENFGAAFQYVNYTECDAKGPNPDPKACKAAGVEGYPTWTIPAGAKLTGTKSLDELSVWSKCPY